MEEEKKKNIFKDITTYFFIIVFIILLRTFVITPIRVNGSSMYPTLSDKEIMILDKISYKFSSIKRFDIVVVDYKNKVTGYGEKLIKRVIGLPGENIYYKDNVLYVDGTAVMENFQRDVTADFKVDSLGYSTIPADCYVVMGDNRNNSTDSRILGCMPKDEILGKTSLVIFPFDNFGNKK